MDTHADHADGADRSQTYLAVGLAAAALLVMIVLSSIDADGPEWILQGVLGLAAAVVAWRAGHGSTRNPLALAALVVGGILFLVFAGYLIAEL